MRLGYTVPTLNFLFTLVTVIPNSETVEIVRCLGILTDATCVVVVGTAGIVVVVIFAVVGVFVIVIVGTATVGIVWCTSLTCICFFRSTLIVKNIR